MPSARRSARGSGQTPGIDLTPHRLVPAREELDAGPDGGLSGLNTIVGYIGPSEDAGRVRIYLDLSFRRYCEVASSDVVQTASVDANDENSPTTVWVRSTARVALVGRMTGDASFISGTLRKQFLPRAAAQAVRGSTAPACSELFFCPTADPCSTPLCPPPSSSSPWGCDAVVLPE
jgi:hypothetical protein